MRITCPSCASHFELPSELLGKKGRALKCATCQHAWYQAAQVESLDLAAVMGEDYAADKAGTPQAARSGQAGQAAQRSAQQNMAGGGIQRVPPSPQNTQEGRRVQTAALGAPRSNTRNVQVGQFRQQPGQPAGAPPVPPGAVSMMRRAQPGQAPGQRGQQAPASTAQSWFAGTDRAPQGQPQQPGAAGGPGGAPQQGAPPGQGAVSWSQNPQQPQGPRTAPLGMAPGAQGGPGAAPLPGQSMRGQAGAAAGPGQEAVSWMQNPQSSPQAGVPGGPGQAPGAQNAQNPQGGPQTAPLGMAPGAQGGPGAAPLPGQSMRGQAGAAAGPGQGAVSWMQNAQESRGGPQTAPLGMAPGAQGGPGAAPLPGQSMRNTQGPAGPGEAAVSWMKPGAQGAPGAPGQSMRDPGGPTGPGGPAVSQLSNEVVAPGAPGQSMRDPGGPTGPGGPAVSQLSNEIVAPGQGSRSLLDGSELGPGAPGQSMLGQDGAGAPGQSMMDAGASGGPGASPVADTASSAGGPGGDQPGAAGASGGPGAGPAAAKEEAMLVAGESKAAADEDDLDSSAPDAEGVTGGPGATAETGDEDELVDPDADRPNFGSADDDEADSDADEEDDEDEEAEEGFALVAARAGGRGTRGVKPKARKPMDPAYVSAAMMGGIVASILAVLWFGRGMLAEMMPEFRSVYDRMGVEAPRPGDGLSISESSKRLQRIGGVETLVVRGFVSNVGEVPRAVPALRLELYDARQEVIQDQTVDAPAALLDPGGSAEFEIRLELPQLSAAKGGYAIVWNAD